MLQTRKYVSLSEPVARYVFICVLMIALVVIYAASSDMYFLGDEWDLLQHRPLASPNSWLDPHNHVHWIPGLVALYGVLFNLVGVDHYWLYHLPGVATHLLAAWMLREVMVRARADEWTATAFATIFAFYGTGAQNLLWAIQVGFTASLAMGLVQLSCASHPVPTRQRDLAGLVAGAVGLAFGGVGVTMAIVVGLATLVLRGWRAAFFHTAPLGVTYLLWWFNFARGAQANAEYGTPVLWAKWIWHGFTEVFGSLVGWAPLGVVLFALTVIGFSMRVRDQFSVVGWWRPLVPVLALACGAVVFQLITALGRVAQPMGAFNIPLGPEYASTSRYVHIVAALVLPLIAVAVSHLVQRYRIVAIALIPLFIIGIVGNVRHLILVDNSPDLDRARHIGMREIVSDAAYSDLIQLVPAETELRIGFFPVTAGWLRDVKSQGQLPEVGGVTPERAAQAAAYLAVQLLSAHNVECHESIEPGIMLDFVAGDILLITAKTFDTTFSAIYESEDGVRVPLVPASIVLSNALHVVAPHARLMFPINPKVEKIERCTDTSVESQ